MGGIEDFELNFIRHSPNLRFLLFRLDFFHVFELSHIFK
jgi:hypothetical protein